MLVYVEWQAILDPRVLLFKRIKSHVILYDHSYMMLYV